MKTLRTLSLIISCGLIIVSSLSVMATQKAAALSASDWQAGRIIDDNVFFVGNAMDIPTIQAFLNSKVPTCDTNGTQPSGHGNLTRAQWGAQNGYPAPYTCLESYTTAVYGTAADQYCSAIPYGNYTAAGIIWAVGQACNVSQKAILVMLQKEQGLVTDDWPWPIEYSEAMGYGCPDSGGCNQSYASFFNQVYFGARQFKLYAANPQNYNYQRGVSANVAYSPNSACSSSSVAFQGQSTAGLYDYTPYQPDQAALNNLGGTGDGCSSYGNRNFWVYYNDWFGNTYGVPFSASFVGESSVTVSVTNGQPATVWFDLENTGSQFWKDSSSALPYYPVTRLMGDWPINRSSAFVDPSWYNAGRPVTTFTQVWNNDYSTLASDQHTVWPGQIARFQFQLDWPSNGISPGTYTEHFALVEDGAPNFWVPGSDVWQNVNVAPAFQASFSSESGAAAVSPGHNSSLSFTFQNTGSQFWKDNTSAPSYFPITRLAGAWPTNRASAFADPSWFNAIRPVAVFTHVYNGDATTLSSDQHTVWPGQYATFQFPVDYPSGGIATGSYAENFELLEDGSSSPILPGGGAWQYVNVTN